MAIPDRQYPIILNNWRTKAIEDLMRPYIREATGWSPAAFIPTTIFIRYMGAVATRIHNRIESGVDPSVNIDNILIVEATNRESEVAEKDGNINLRFVDPENTPLVMEQLMERLVAVQEIGSDNVIRLLVHQPEDDTIGTDIRNVEKIMAFELSDKHKIVLHDRYLGTTVAMMYFVAMRQTMMQELIDNPESRGQHFNLGDLLEVFVFRKNGEIRVTLAPGEAMKIAVKGDGLTEH